MTNRDEIFARYSNSLLRIVRGKTLHGGDTDKAFTEITEAAAETLKVERSSIWLYADNRTKIRCADLFERTPKRHSRVATLNALDFPAYFAAMDENRAIDAHDAHRDPRTREFSQPYLTPLGITSMLDAPIHYHGRTIGVVCQEHIGPARRWTPAEIAYAGSIADLTSLALEARDRRHAEQALRESEERFRAIVDNAPNGIALQDEEGRFLLVNETYAAWLNADRANIAGKKMDAFFPREEAEAMSRLNQRVLSSGAVWVGETTRRFPDGETRIFSNHKIPIDLKSAESRAIISIMTDLTRYKRAEEAREKALVEAERANQTKSDFLAAMSHELRTPLNAILGFAEMLSRQYFGPLGDEKYKQYAENIHASGAHLLDMVNDLLDLSTIEAGKPPPVEERVVLQDAVEDCLNTVKGALKGRVIDLSAQVAERTPPLHGNSRAVKQIILNLLSNAIKYTADGGKVELRVAPSGGSVTITVRDNGIGIPHEKLGTVTQPFVRNETNPHLAQDGAGLGLAITRSLIDLHRGELNIESSIGIGTTVTVILPIHAP